MTKTVSIVSDRLLESKCQPGPKNRRPRQPYKDILGGSKIGCKGQYLRDLCGFCILQMLMLDHDQFLGPGVSVHCLLTD